MSNYEAMARAAEHERHPYTADEIVAECYGNGLPRKGLTAGRRGLPHMGAGKAIRPQTHRERVDSTLDRLLGGVPKPRAPRS